jgi:hypothetical protein
MSKPSPVQPTHPDAAANDSDNDVPVTPEVERIIRERLETFDRRASVGRRARGSEGAPPTAPVAPLTHPVRLSALAALEPEAGLAVAQARTPPSPSRCDDIDDRASRVAGTRCGSYGEALATCTATGRP